VSFFKSKKKDPLEHLDKNLLKSLNKKKLPSWKQLTHIGKYLNRWERLVIDVLILVMAICGVWLLAYVYQHNSESQPDFGGTLVEGMIQDPIYINPILSTGNSTDSDLCRLIYSGLLKYDKNLKLVPDLAEKYEISEDGKTYTFTLREDLFFHNDEPLTVDDIIFTYNVIQNPEYKSPNYLNLANTKVDRIDEKTVSFTTDSVYAPFIHLFTIGILPAHIWENIGPANFPLAQYNIKPIGSGPYKFDKLLKDTFGNIANYELSYFENYYGPEPYIPKITFKFYDDQQTAINALVKGDINALGNLPIKEKSFVEDKKNAVTTYALTLPQYTAVFYNVKYNSFVKNAYFRQALNLSIDKNQIINDLFQENVQVVGGPVLPGSFVYSTDLQQQGADTEKAKQLLIDNGWTLSEANIWKKTTDNVETEATIKLTIPNTEEILSVANALKEAWQNFGFKVEIQAVDTTEIKQIIKERNYETVIYGENIGADPDLFPFWHSTQIDHPGLNLAQMASKQIDTLIEEARQTHDVLTRQTKYAELQKLIIDENVALFLYSPKYLYALKNEIKNYQNIFVNNYAGRWNDLGDLYIKSKSQIKW
jgi:peptide/nickel transport system substrate-binding protein